MTDSTKKLSVTFETVDEGHAGQRVDNFLTTRLKGVPKGKIYKILRKGEVRVNKKRVKPETKLADGDIVRIPPIVIEERAVHRASDRMLAEIEQAIVHEDKQLIVVNKPSGIAVHGGSGINLGLIEMLRQLRPLEKNLELVHRLDRDTSGLILIAKKRSMLTYLHGLLRGDGVDKRYLALVPGSWSKRKHRVDAALLKNHLQSGERVVRVSPEGKRSLTLYEVVERLRGSTLVEAKPVTGRTHQIRVHCQYAGHPICGDVKYDNEAARAIQAESGLTRLFLHAWRLEFKHPDGHTMRFEAPLEGMLKQTVERLR